MPENIIDEAKGICCGDRAAAYGHPIEAYTRVAKFWSAHLKVEIKPRDVAVMMILFKVGREGAKPNRDNLLDAIGYAWCADEIDKVGEVLDGDGSYGEESPHAQ